MSTSNPTPQEPTQQQGFEVGQTAAAAAAQAPAAQREQAAATAVDQYAQERNLKISEEDKRQIAAMAAAMASDMTIDKLEKMGSFEREPATPVTPAPATAAPAPGAEPTAPGAAPAQEEPKSESWAKRHGFF